MKNLLASIGFICFVVFGYAQDIAEIHNDFKKIANNYNKPNRANDYSKDQLNSIDTIPGFETKANKLKITGIIYESDGVTPAKDVMLSIYHADEKGGYNLDNSHDRLNIDHRGWIKTNANGEYTFYTFIPGSAVVPVTFPRRKGAKKIFPVIKEPGKAEYELNAFVFEDDPLLSKSCRKRLKRKGIDSILTLENKGNIYVANKNIVLK